MLKNHLTLSSKARLTAVGIRFNPTDKELILHYLSNKVHGYPLPSATAVIDFDIYGDCRRLFRFFHEREEDTLHFFTRLKLKTDNGSRVDRLTDLGTWRSQLDTPVGEEGKPVGFKRSFSFKPKEGFEDIGRWVMYEYRLDAVPLGHHYVICKIIKKQPEGIGRRRRMSRSNTSETGNNNHNFMLFNVGGLSGGAAGHQEGMECGNCGMEPQTGAVAVFRGQFGYGHAAGYQGRYLQGQGHALCVTGSGGAGSMVVHAGAGLNTLEAQSNAVDHDFGSYWECTDGTGMNATNGAARSNGEEIFQSHTVTKPACADNGDGVILKSETLEWNSAKDLENIIDS